MRLKGGSEVAGIGPKLLGGLGQVEEIILKTLKRGIKMNEFYVYKLRLLDGSIEYVRTKNSSLVKGDIIKYITTVKKTSYHVGVVVSNCVKIASSFFARTSMPLTNIANVNSFDAIKSCPYYLSFTAVNTADIDADFRERYFVSIPETVSIEVDFGIEENADMLKGYRVFSDSGVLALLFSKATHSCIAFVRNEECEDGIEEIHFRLDAENNAVDIVSSKGSSRLTDTIFAALTFALTVDFKGSFAAINSELYGLLKDGADNDCDNDAIDTDDFDPILKMFSSRRVS